MRTPFLSPNRRVRPPSVPAAQHHGASDNLRGTLLMIASMATFTCNDAVIKAVTQTLPLYESVAIRGAAVLAMMVAVAQIQQGGVRLSVPREDLLPLVVRTVADIASTVLYLLALREMALADLSAILQALPLGVTLAAGLFFHERLGWRRLSAIGVGFVGVVMILRPGSGAFDIWSMVALASMLLIVLRDIVTPLQALARVARAVHHEHAVGQRVPPARLAELRMLGDDFNALLDELERRQSLLEEKNGSSRLSGEGGLDLQEEIG